MANKVTSIPLIGGSVESDSQDANFQVLMNMFVSLPGTDARAKQILKPTSGLYEIEDLGGTACRGIITIGDYTYVVRDSSVYRLTINPLAKTCETLLLGSINSTLGQVKFAHNPTQLLIVDSSPHGYIITLSTGVLTTIADTDFVGGLAVCFCDGYFFYVEENTAFLRSSTLNDGTTWDAADVAIAESKPDNLVGLAVNKGEVWAFGTDTVEVWYDAANLTNFPFSPRVGSEIDIGCSAPGSIVELNNLIMWLDSRGFVVQSQISAYVRNQSSGYDLKVVSNPVINSIFASYNFVSDAIACSYMERGHIIYQITFPSERVTWAYDTITDIWFQRGTYDDFYGRVLEHAIQYTDTVSNVVVGCGYLSGKVYLMSEEFKDDAGVPIQRKHTSAPIFSDGMTCVNKLRMIIGAENVPATGLGSNPQVSIRYSNDGSHSWSNFMSRDIGKSGIHGRPINWNRLGTARQWVVEINICEPIDFSIIEATMHVTIEEVT